jgi:pimeloyl-ACP methyl ester carboxylesterase
MRSTATVESRWIDVGGLRIHTRVTEGLAESGAPIVVLVHGVGVASPYFVPTMQQLAPHFQVFAIDLPGFGRSDKPSHTLSIAELADALAAWLRAEGLERPILLGNSVGCQVVVDFAARYPEHLSCLILAGPTMDPEARTAWQQIVRWLRNARSERLSQVPLSVRDYWQCGIRRLIGTFRCALDDHIEEKLPRVRVPTLVVRGSQDTIVPQRWTEEAVRLLPQGRLVVIPGAGHTVNYNSPVELARVVRTFTGVRDQQLGQEVPSVAASEETPRLRAIPVIGRSQRVIADFDSASAMVRATGRFLRGKDFPQLGMLPSPLMPLMELVATALNALPKRGRELFYIYSSGSEAIPPERLETLQAEDISRWVVNQYPRRTYPAAMIGSSNGAAVHLCAALGIPWLPQTVLIPVQHPGIPADEPKQDMEWGREPGRRLLAANPELALHHMHDANQDRLTIQRLTYFRVKRLRLGETYEWFLQHALQPGATIFLLECGLRWPTTRIGERHLFQHGALGGATPEEYLRGGERVANYLGRYGSRKLRWDSPQPDGESPEAEWGFESALRDDVLRLAQERGYRVRRIVFDEPEALSPLVADFYRWWYRERGLPGDRLLVESFILMEPYWALRTGSVPFWMVFNTEPSAAALERYMEVTEPYDDIRLMLFSHGADSVGVVPITRWRSILARARKSGDFVGVDQKKFPRDLATLVRYYTQVKKIPARYPLPGPLTLERLDTFLEREGHRYEVEWIESRE